MQVTMNNPADMELKTCAGCEMPIQERFLLNLMDRHWHTTCLKCSACGVYLTEKMKCYTRAGQIFCPTDFFNTFGQKCGGCDVGIAPNVLVRRARGKAYHLRCFTCTMCSKQLSTGEELIVVENKFLCKEDYMNNTSYARGSDDELELDSAGMLGEDRLSDNGSGANDCDSRDSSLPPSLTPLRLDHSAAHAPPPMMDVDGLLPHGLKSPIKTEKNNNNDVATLNSSVEAITMNSSISSNPSDHTNNKENTSSKDAGEEKDGSGSEAEADGEEGDGKKKTTGTKRRGPRTTIKAKQLEVLKEAFNATPKPTRHIREQLAQQTGLNMRVIQVWFQNRRSKERRMKQLSQLGARRAFYRNPRRMRGLGDDGDMMGGPGFPFYDNGEFYPGEYYGDGQGMPPFMHHPGQGMPPFMHHPGPQGTPPMDPNGIPVGPMPGHDGGYPGLMPHEMMQQQQQQQQQQQHNGGPPPSPPENGLHMDSYMTNHIPVSGPPPGFPGGLPMHPAEMQTQERW